MSYLPYGVFMKCFLFFFHNNNVKLINFVVLVKGKDFDGKLVLKELVERGFVEKKFLKEIQV